MLFKLPKSDVVVSGVSIRLSLLLTVLVLLCWSLLVLLLATGDEVLSVEEHRFEPLIEVRLRAFVELFVELLLAVIWFALLLLLLLFAAEAASGIRSVSWDRRREVDDDEDVFVDSFSIRRSCACWIRLRCCTQKSFGLYMLFNELADSSPNPAFNIIRLD